MERDRITEALAEARREYEAQSRMARRIERVFGWFCVIIGAFAIIGAWVVIQLYRPFRRRRHDTD